MALHDSGSERLPLIRILASGIPIENRVSLVDMVVPQPPSGKDPVAAVDASPDESMMALALELAREARNLGEVPVGAVVVRAGRILAQSFNLRETLHDPTAHAERLALTWAGQAIGSWRHCSCCSSNRAYQLRHQILSSIRSRPNC